MLVLQESTDVCFEFEYEYINSAEEVLNSIYMTSNWDDLEKAFYLALMGIYNQYIEERYFRHRLARSHNLITHIMRDLMCNQSKQLFNHISRPRVVKKGCCTTSTSGVVSRIKKLSRGFCFSDGFRKRKPEYPHKLKHSVDGVSDFNLNCNVTMTGHVDTGVFGQSLALAPKHLSCPYKSVPMPHLKQYCVSYQVIQNGDVDSSTVNLNIPDLCKNLAVPHITKRLLVRDDSWLTESYTSSEILDSGISSAESSSNSTTSCGNFSDQLNLTPFKPTNDLLLSSHIVPIRPRSNSDSVCDSVMMKSKNQYPNFTNQIILSSKSTNSGLSETGLVTSVIECLSQSADKINTPFPAPQKRRRGRPSGKYSAISSLSENQNTEKQNEQTLLMRSMSNSKTSDIGSCGKTQYHSSGNRTSQVDISSNLDMYNSIKSLTWLVENVETPLTVPVHRRRGRPPRNPISYNVCSAKKFEKTFLT
ncbi:unnamed protein product [Schistosoma turkestanicum]|nr:unnamed protein product [Schistosoma turkestanicum]